MVEMTTEENTPIIGKKLLLVLIGISALAFGIRILSIGHVLHDGQVVWEHDIDSTASSLSIMNSTLLVTTINGNVSAFNLKP